MRSRLSTFLCTAVLAAAGALAMALPDSAAGEPAPLPGTFVVLSDIHFSPFANADLAPALARSSSTQWPSILAAAKEGPTSPPGQDSNYPLLASAMAQFGKAMAGADFALVPGDLLVHLFNVKAAALLNTESKSPAIYEFAEKTTVFVLDSLTAALGGKPAILALGNNDSGCGDYRIDPGGAYLAATRDAVRRLVGPERVATDFDETYAAGGYYAVRHPTAANGLVIVLNDVIWSTHYQDVCGQNGTAAAQAMLRWLREQLAAARATGGRVWMVHHIPWGIDAYASLISKAPTCSAQVSPFLQEPYASELPALLATYRDVVQMSFSGHTHFDDNRLLLDEQGMVLSTDKLSPAISPVFGQNPAFQVFAYDRRTGAPSDYSTWYLANPGEPATKADWRFEYNFSKAYGQPYSAQAIGRLWKTLANDSALQADYRTFYNVSRGALDPARFPAYSCAIGNLSPSAFAACFCGDRR